MNSITKKSLELVKGALARPDDTLAKSISTATGLLAYDLQAPAKNLYPFVTPIRNVDAAGRRRHRNGDKLAPGQRHHRLRLRLHGLGAGRPALGSDVVYDLEQIGDVCDDRRGGCGDFRSNLRRAPVRGHPGANDLPPAAENDAEGRDGDPRGQRLLAAGDAGDPDPVGLWTGRHAAGRHLFGQGRGADPRGLSEFERSPAASPPRRRSPAPTARPSCCPAARPTRAPMRPRR